MQPTKARLTLFRIFEHIVVDFDQQGTDQRQTPVPLCRQHVNNCFSAQVRHHQVLVLRGKAQIAIIQPVLQQFGVDLRHRATS